MKIGIFTCLMLLCGIAQAQTYDISISLSNVMGSPGTFEGSFTLANGLMSAINVSDPTAYGGVFNSGTDSGGAIQLQDQYDGYGSDTLRLNFNMDGTAISFSQSPNGSTGLYSCMPQPGFIAETCSMSIKAQAAPEIGWDGGLLTLLAGLVLVMRGKLSPQKTRPLREQAAWLVASPRPPALSSLE